MIQNRRQGYKSGSQWVKKHKIFEKDLIVININIKIFFLLFKHYFYIKQLKIVLGRYWGVAWKPRVCGCSKERSHPLQVIMRIEIMTMRIIFGLYFVSFGSLWRYKKHFMQMPSTRDAPSKIVITELGSICIFLQVYEYYLPRIDQEDKHTRRGFQADGEHCCSSGFI